MRYIPLLLLSIILSSCASQSDTTIEETSLASSNAEMAQLFMDNLLSDQEVAKSLLHQDFSFAWMGTPTISYSNPVTVGEKEWNRDDLFDVYFPEVVGTLLPNGITFKTVDVVADEDGVAIVQVGESVGRLGEEYNNTYVWIFKMKDGLIHSLREYNSDLLVATRLYDYEIVQ